MIQVFDNARWIGLITGDPGVASPCPFLRKSFVFDRPVRRAILHWTALGVAELWLNGERVSDGVLEPGWSDFRKRAQVMRVDVTELLQTGPNTLGAILGDGWYCGALTWLNQRNHYGDHARLLAGIEVEFSDGTHARIVSDGSWEAATGPILEAELYHGESYDAQREIAGWCQPALTSSGNWRPVDAFPEYEGILQIKRNEPSRVIEELASVSITSHKEMSWIADFGQNLVGFCRIKLKNTRPGQEITLRFAEMLNADGSLYVENLRSARATDLYICKGAAEEVWQPRFTFHGFRYAEISGTDTAPDGDTLTALVVHSDLRPTGQFECSDPDINQLVSNIRWGMRGNFIDVPTDCPQRDERLGWTGDAQIFVGTAAFHYDVRRFFEKWMFDLVDGQSGDGAFPDVAPDVVTPMLPHFKGNAAWGDAGVIIPWKIFWHFGDRTILEENYDAMVHWIDFQEGTSRGRLRPPTAYGDWLAIDAVTPARAPVPSDLVGTAYFAHTTDLMRRIAGVLGRQADEERFAALHAGITDAFQNEYVSPNGRVVGDCQTGYLLALAFDLLPEDLRPRAVKRLIELIESRDWHLTTGFVGTPLLCPVLSRFGRTDVAYKLLLQDTYPSWLYPIRNGATTMWERWNSYTKEHGFGPVGMNSFNHYAYGAVGEWMYAVVGGLRCEAPGYRRVLIAPEPGDGITAARASLTTPSGTLACAWCIEDGVLQLDIETGEGMDARVRLPDGYTDENGAREIAVNPGFHRVRAHFSK